MMALLSTLVTYLAPILYVRLYPAFPLSHLAKLI